MKIHLVDGTYELFRSYYAVPSSTAPDGAEVGATRGLMRSLLSLLEHPDVTHVAVAYDHVIESFRNDLFDGYKTGDGIDPDLRGQFDLAEEATAALGLVVWSMVEFEADDALAAGAANYIEDDRVSQVVLCSPDKDMCQCVVADRIVTYDRMRDTVRDHAGVIEKFGVPPASIPDYLALVGDSADGIPGIPRWGAKSTATLLARYGGMHSIPDDETTWDIKVRGAAALAKNLRENREAAELYRVLATLRTDVPLTETVDDLEWVGADPAPLEAFCKRIGARNIVGRVSRWRD